MIIQMSSSMQQIHLFHTIINCYFHLSLLFSQPKVCAVTSLGYDHTEMLGNTMKQIAWHKAGIFKVPKTMWFELANVT